MTVPKRLHRLIDWFGKTFEVPGDREPGFILHVPFLLVLRYFILIAIGMRFVLHSSDYELRRFALVSLFVGIFLLTTIAVTIISLKLALRNSRKIQIAVISLDVGLLSILYVLTDNPQSDFFLFYYLPLLTAAEYLGVKAMLYSVSAVTVVFAVVLGIQRAPVMRPAPAGWEIVFRVFIPRAVFFLASFLPLASCSFVKEKREQGQIGGQRR